ncbi:putative adenosylmethionine-8-amino-7-oxononanoate aminotransferase [Burkholderia sp. ABCPW 111]|nr:putative adenosylmethionine-8-amino-7-oxononanoate aminotransferase [Burkholderia sp. ABCPW 111]
MGFRRQQDHRRDGRALVRERRLRARGADRGRQPAAARTAVLQHVLQDHAPADHRAVRAARPDRAAVVQPLLLLQQRLRGQRYGAARRASVLAHAEPPAKEVRDLAQKRLSRLDDRGRDARRHGLHARADAVEGRAHRAHRSALLLRRSERRANAGGVRARARAAARGEDSRARRGQRRGVHRRAVPGRGRRDLPAVDVLARDRANLPQVRRAARRRRGDRRIRAHRRMVRASALRLRAGSDDAREGADERLRADGRGRAVGPDRRRADRARRVQSRDDVLRASGRGGGGGGEPDIAARREDRRAREDRYGPLLPETAARDVFASSDRRRDLGRGARRGPAARARAGRAQALRERRRGRHDLPRLLLQRQPDHARDGRPDAAVAAARGFED